MNEDGTEEEARVVQLGAGTTPILLAGGKIRQGRGVPGLGGGMILSGTRTSNGLKMKVLSLRELQHQVLTLVSPHIQERWYADVTISDRRGDFLIDGGATTSMITKKFYDSLSNPPPVIPTNVEVKVADGRIIHSSGLTVVPMKVGNLWYGTRLLIMDGLDGNEDGILGIDWQYIHDVTMSMRSG